MSGQYWTRVESTTRKGLLCALTGADPDSAVLEECGFDVRLRVIGEAEPRVVLTMWEWHGVIARIEDFLA